MNQHNQRKGIDRMNHVSAIYKEVKQKKMKNIMIGLIRNFVKMGIGSLGRNSC